MENKKKKKIKKKFQKKKLFPFDKKNYLYFITGLFLLFIGYIFMMQGPADSFWSRTLAPVILIISYCVVFPIAILSKGRKEETE